MGKSLTAKKVKKLKLRGGYDFTVERNTSEMSLHERKTKPKQDKVNNQFKKDFKKMESKAYLTSKRTG